jgi:hypothetical protein
MGSAHGLVDLGEFVFRLAYFQNEELRLQNSEPIHRMLSFFGEQDGVVDRIEFNMAGHLRQCTGGSHVLVLVLYWLCASTGPYFQAPMIASPLEFKHRVPFISELSRLRSAAQASGL